jgi:hypothetical protein
MTQFLSRRTALIFASAFAVPSALPILALAKEDGSKAVDPLSSELTNVVLPVVRAGAPVTFLFCAIKIQVSDSGSTFFFRENHFLLRDAITRIASRSPIPAGPTPNSFDRVAITRVVLRAIQAVRPSAQVVRITVTSSDFMRN